MSIKKKIEIEKEKNDSVNTFKNFRESNRKFVITVCIASTTHPQTAGLISFKFWKAQVRIVCTAYTKCRNLAMGGKRPLSHKNELSKSQIGNYE